MGSFFLTSKKASATVIVLVISIIIVSSGVIIVNEVEKSNNENNVAGTGLVLLDNEQNNLDALLDSSDNEIKLFTFGDSERKSSSKKSSGGGDSTDSQIYNELEIPNNDETIDNQTSDNQTETNSTEEINETDFSDGQIFEQNGTTYIMRDSAAYILASSSQINFNPPLPSSVCVLPSDVGERINIKLVGSLSPVLNFNGALVCLYADYVGADIELKIMEDDLIGDDLIASITFHVSVDCDNPKVDYSKVFENVDLSSQFGGTADQSRIEVYGLVKLTSNNFHNIEYSTSNYDIDKLTTCDCLSGPCCDLSSRPYIYKPSGSQPTGYTDYYYCSVTNSPTGTSYCREMDYYCSGNSAGYSYSSSNVDTCGICEYCTYGDPTCNYYSSSYSCGTKNCDYLDTTCRNYHDVSKYCSSGSCISPSCTSYTNKPKHTSCGTDNECDGSGTCVTCTSHSYTGCSYNDVYYYDACDNKEEKKDECGNSYCGDWYRDTCHGDDAYETQRCHNKGCTTTASLGVHCYSNSYENERFVETCQYGCINGNCKSNPDIACFFNWDCGQNGFSGNPYCSDDDIYDWFREYVCHYPGTEQSFCSDDGHGSMIQDCLEDFYSDNYCYDDDVYQNFTDKGCLDGACFENTTAQFVQECGIEGCSNGECVYVECYNHTMCDPDNNLDNNYVGDPWCSNDDVWQNYINYTCNYAGTGNSYCSNSTTPVLKEPCGSDYCEDWGSNYCMSDDVYHEKTCHDKGCSDGVCFDNTYTEEEKVEECGISEYTGDNYCYSDDVYRDYITRTCSDSSCTSSTSKKKIEDCTNGCTDGRCLIEVCKTICNFGTCYEYCVWQ